ncbi:MAG: SDR family NAD(P)-dependent oxidoreductase, partial [Desulfobacterales bacterium]|nr:SDR family NAD(P)-dependent oxidoreductase [Desulfobacterales bacterium]
RWDWKAYYGDPMREPNKTRAKWGGFISDVDKFDPLFFGISPREAELMDPQQRLFLQTVWKTIEDAGYKPSDLSGTETGLFVGVSSNDYAEIISQNASEIEAHAPTGVAHSVLANRISYLLNLNGPSEPIDTACSSSLVAIHRGVEAICSGSCEMAIAGGVHVMLTPSATIAFSKAGMLSEDGKCKTFDSRADGYVRGEGVGAVFLKPLSKAISDNDYIYGTILGTAENHGGHATSLTAPNPKAQAKLLIKAYEKANVSPESVTYIETHGTGTSLGDPIEINALKNAFHELFKKQGKNPKTLYLGLGSVKTNIGHLETASGIAGVIKVLLSMKYKKLPPIINFKELNPYIKLEESPFYIVTEAKNWESPNNNLRRAGISSFGFGGANAHIILEEYETKKQDGDELSYYLILLSAKNEERLKKYAENLLDFLKINDDSLTNIAYTLQAGREAFEERIAIVISNKDELIQKLSIYIEGDTSIDDLYHGTAKKDKFKSKALIEGRAGKEFLKIIIEDKDLSKIAELWVSGVDIDWNLLYTNKKPFRIPIPTYPFSKDRYWIAKTNLSPIPFPKVKVDFEKEVMFFETVWEKSDIEFGDKLKTDSDLIIFNEKKETAIYSIYDLIKGDISSLNRILFFYNGNEDSSKPFFEAVSGYSKSLNIIYPKLRLSTIEVSNNDDIENIASKELSLNNDLPMQIRYSGKDRYIKRVKPIKLNKSKKIPLKEKGTYLITGGAGGLGHIFADFLYSKYNANIIICGRSHQRQVSDNFLYIQGDVSNLEDMKEVVKKIENKYGNIDGVIHAAGIFSKNTIINKEKSEFESTLRPKIEGTIILDELTKSHNMDFFVLFSSTSSILGDFGQCDYAVANRFLDSFAEYREKLRLKDERKGRTISINWPLWIDGGMHQNNEGEKFYLETSGMSYLQKEEGISAFEDILSNPYSQVITIKGDPKRILGFFSNKTDIESTLQNIASKIVKIPSNKLDINESLGNYGFDSISLKLFADKISETYKIEFPPSIFFANSTISRLKSYLSQNLLDSRFISNDVIPAKAGIYDEKNLKSYSTYSMEPIAVIGMHGIFPNSSNLKEFWKNLEEEKDLITKFPSDRWGYEKETDSTWGGFIPDIDKFDANFFKITPREAEMMDPQHRLFIESVWKTVEDAGYKASFLSGKSIGIFVGVQFNDYQQLLLASGESNPHSATGTSHAMIANRISYLMNWHGPSETIDTACSSSLVALHHAVRSILLGESEMAIAGGVSLIISPATIFGTSKLGVLSPDGRCKTFDKSANGYVKGEGVGTILLKRLSKAIQDNDNIYAQIIGTAVNHGGKAASLTAPNSDAQAELLSKAYKNASIEPETITYLELHGTGTQLGDSVEVDGIKKAFGEISGKKNFCGIGSVKSNIGHLEPASGIAGIIKIILSMQNKKLPASIHVKTVNPYIKIEDSPFYIVKNTKNWDKIEDNIKRRAGVSAFGFGGANAHAVLEEYEDLRKNSKSSDTNLFILSAKNEERLRAYVKDMLQFLEPDSNLSDICYTLQNGREDMEKKLILVVSNINELKAKLTNFLNGEAISENDKLILNIQNTGKRISIPTYPFAKERYWVSIKTKTSEQNLKRILSKEEFYLKDHIIAGDNVLPGVFYIEMARKAGEGSNIKINKIINTVWSSPIIVSDSSCEVYIKLSIDKDKVSYEISTTKDGILHCNGKLINDESFIINETFDISLIQNRCNNIIEGENLYQIFKENSLNYGPSFQAIQKLYINEKEALSYLVIPESVQTNFNDFVLHPSLMDGAFQTISGLLTGTEGNSPYLPFILGELTIIKPLTPVCFAYATISETSDSKIRKFNIDMLNNNGELLIRIKNFSLRPLKKDITINKIYLQNLWKKSEIEIKDKASLTEPVLIFDLDESRYNSFVTALCEDITLAIPGEKYIKINEKTYSINPSDPSDYKELIENLNKKPKYIIHMWSQDNFAYDEKLLLSQIERSFYSLFHLSQALLKQKLTSEIQLIYIYKETENNLQPQYAALSGFIKTLAIENPKLICKTIAISDLSKVQEAIYNEFKVKDAFEVCYKDNIRFTKQLIHTL